MVAWSAVFAFKTFSMPHPTGFKGAMLPPPLPNPEAAHQGEFC